MPQESVSQNLNDLFGQALALQKDKKWDESLTAYQKIIDLGPDQLGTTQASVLYHNMSTVAFEKSDFLKAYIWSKKAVSLNPANQQAVESLEVYAKKVEIPNIPHQISNFDNFEKIIDLAPLDLWMVLTLIILLLTFRQWLKRFVLIKKNQAQGIYQKPSAWLVYILSILSVVTLVLGAIRYESSLKQQAIVIADKAPVQTVPGDNKPVIYEVPAGAELDVLSEKDNYFQVRYPGAFSGWVSKNQLELMSLTFRHTL
ncbi:MAG: hypothetical protein ACXVAX_00220 [Pseudobdellovibrio sp.]